MNHSVTNRSMSDSVFQGLGVQWVALGVGSRAWSFLGYGLQQQADMQIPKDAAIFDPVPET